MKRKIYINGRFLTQSTTGVQRYGQEIIKSFDEMIGKKEIHPNLFELVLLTPPQEIRDLGLRNLEIRPVGRFTGHLWEQWDLPNHSQDGLLFCPGNLAPYRSLMSKRSGTVVTLHDLSFSYFSQAYSWRFTLIYELIVQVIVRSATAVITVSENEKSKIVSAYPELHSRMTSVHHGVRPAYSYPPVSKIPGDPPYILFVGSINRIKNLDGLLEALSLVQTALPLRLKIVGSNSSPVFRPVDLSRQLQKVDHVEFLGQVNDPEILHHLYVNATFLCVPSFSESFGFPCLEAMAHGCPVLAADIGGLREICGEAALFCDPFDPVDIAEKMWVLCNHPEKRERLVEVGYQQVAKFTWEKCSRETWKILRACSESL